MVRHLEHPFSRGQVFLEAKRASSTLPIQMSKFPIHRYRRTFFQHFDHYGTSRAIEDPATR